MKRFAGSALSYGHARKVDTMPGIAEIVATVALSIATTAYAAPTACPLQSGNKDALCSSVREGCAE